jgi:hypothetical protein
VKQLAWLHAVPDKQEHPRLERMKTDGIAPSLPDTPAKHLIDYLFEIGPTISGGTIPPSEIAAWQSFSGVELLPWEAKELRYLSSVYGKQLHESTAPDCPPPYMSAEDIARNREAVSNRLGVNMRAYILANTKH